MTSDDQCHLHTSFPSSRTIPQSKLYDSRLPRISPNIAPNQFLVANATQETHPLCLHDCHTIIEIFNQMAPKATKDSNNDLIRIIKALKTILFATKGFT